MLTLVSRAKINLTLAVTGKQADGFHSLVSLVTAVDLSDSITIEPAAKDQLECNWEGLEVGENNLVLRAANLFRQRSGFLDTHSFTLNKKIPLGAGFGGGSGNAAATLLGLNELAGKVLSAEQLRSVAAELGSDVPLFLEDAPVLMRGRGEQIEPVGQPAWLGEKVLLFKPNFSIPTAWAYQRLAQAKAYCDQQKAEDMCESIVSTSTLEQRHLYNDFERVILKKFQLLPVLFGHLQKEYGCAVLLSGSGSGCFVLGRDLEGAELFLLESLGADALIVHTEIVDRFCQ